LRVAIGIARSADGTKQMEVLHENGFHLPEWDASEMLFGFNIRSRSLHMRETPLIGVSV
jgi:hypothetical protein